MNNLSDLENYYYRHISYIYDDIIKSNNKEHKNYMILDLLRLYSSASAVLGFVQADKLISDINLQIDLSFNDNEK